MKNIVIAEKELTTEESTVNGVIEAFLNKLYEDGEIKNYDQSETETAENNGEYNKREIILYENGEKVNELTIEVYLDSDNEYVVDADIK